MDQGPGWWVAGSGLRPWRIPELEEVQALTLRFQGGARAPALKPPSRGLRMRLGQQGLPPGAGRGGAFPRLLLPLQPGLWGVPGVCFILPGFPAWMGAQASPSSALYTPLLGTGEQPTPSYKQRGVSLLSPVQAVQETPEVRPHERQKGEEEQPGLSFQTEMPGCGGLSFSLICTFVPVTHETMWG